MYLLPPIYYFGSQHVFNFKTSLIKTPIGYGKGILQFRMVNGKRSLRRRGSDMLNKFTEKKVRLTIFVLLLGLILVAVVLRATLYCTGACSPCAIMSSDGRTIPTTPCHCTSYANYLFQIMFGHNERHSETMT